jgi:hypothetical protein
MPKRMPHEILFHPYVTEKTMFQMEGENKLEFEITRVGKRAMIKLTEDYSAEDVGMRIGIF